MRKSLWSRWRGLNENMIATKRCTFAPMDTKKTSSIYHFLERIILTEGILEYFEVSNLYEEHVGIIEDIGLE